MTNTTEAPRIYPIFRYQNPKRIIDWLTATFGFSVRVSYGGGDDVHHAELVLGSSMIMLGRSRDDAYGTMVGGPGHNGGKSVYVAVDDSDAVYARAVAAGATILEGLTDKDYGSRDFICADPEGNVWSVGTYWPKASDPA